MTRLPTPHGDDGTWGDILNDWLRTMIAPAELGYAENTNDELTLTNVDVPGCVVTVTVGPRPIKVIGETLAYNDTAGGSAALNLYEGATLLRTGLFKSVAANDLGIIHIERRLSPSPGSHTYKLNLQRFTAGTAHADGLPTAGPTFIQVVQL